MPPPQAHAGGMGSACAFSPSRPRLLASLSKGGELALVDTASAGLAAPAGGPAAAAEAAAAPRVLWRRQLAGPVFGCAWLAAGALGCDAEQLAVVGADCAVRLYEAGKKDADAGGWASTCLGGRGTFGLRGAAPAVQAQRAAGALVPVLSAVALVGCMCVSHSAERFASCCLCL